MAKRSGRLKPAISDSVKASVSVKAQHLIDEHLKPTHIQPPPAERFDTNYIIDIFTKWHGVNLFFCATYASEGPNAISPTFEVRFARMAFEDNGKFSLSFMRHTEQWCLAYSGLTADECLEAIRDDPLFSP